MTSQDYQSQLIALLPRGQLWSKLVSIWQSLLLALGDSLARVDLDIQNLQIEADPRTCSGLLPEWEAATGLPDTCIPGGGTIPQRRQAVVVRLASTGGANKAYFIALAAGYGYTITITETATNTFRVNSATAVGLVSSTCDSTCDDQLQAFGNNQLECLINRLKPAHTVVSFAYGP